MRGCLRFALATFPLRKASSSIVQRNKNAIRSATYEYWYREGTNSVFRFQAVRLAEVQQQGKKGRTRRQRKVVGRQGGRTLFRFSAFIGIHPERASPVHVRFIDFRSSYRATPTRRLSKCLLVLYR